MIDTPEIVETVAQQTAVIHLTIPRDEIQSAMGPAIQEVFATLAAQGIAPAGPLFDRHFAMNDTTFDFEVGVPVATPVTPAGRVYAGELPAVRAVRTTYHGGYEGLGAAWGEFDGWVTAQGHVAAPGLREHFLAGPESGEDSAQWRTELVRPLA
ncbi:MAG: GyrI-like domain-containing protein [Chloroflexi bacterium]|nr:GyrI-like domain-containing protein [Chloroflexota bacterium]